MKESRKLEIVSLLEVTYWEFDSLFSKTKDFKKIGQFSLCFADSEKVTKTLDFTCSYCNYKTTIMLTTRFDGVENHCVMMDLLSYLLQIEKLISDSETNYFYELFDRNPELNLIRFCKSCSITNRILPLQNLIPPG